KTIGIVTGVQAMRWYHLIIEGKESHAGTTPMHLRQDPVKAAVAILHQAYALVEQYTPDIRLTFGSLRPEPGVINTIPGKLTITVDLRHPETTALNQIEQDLNAIATEGGGKLEKIWDSPPVRFAAECIAAVDQAVETTGVSAMRMISGAGHDAVYVSRVAPTSMIFIPCEDGLSHNELENVQKEDVVAGANVLLQAMLAIADTDI
ncbi:MAG: M20 family metallo-hydrolase, partial [Chloroflexi bacterium]|nr:M20 family metallo-hydrolase [Chloroflexota bacterium]